MRKYIILILMTYFFASACSSVDSSEDDSGNTYVNLDSDWLIPSDEVYMGASKDQIEAIDKPVFVANEEIDFMEPDDLILGIRFGDEIRGYPHKVMNYHEIVNDKVGDIPFALTFCPLTGSGIAWNRRVTSHDTSTFGVSGRIYKNNLIAYDRVTESYWSQMMLQSVHGPLMGSRPWVIYHNVIEMTWEAWIQAFPDAEILKGITRLSHAYDSYPYGKNYPSNNDDIIFPIGNEDDRLERKTLSRGINYNATPVVFPMHLFEDGLKVINYNFKGGNVVIAGNQEQHFMVSYFRQLNGDDLEFSATTKPLPYIMEDEKGNVWNIFGEAVSGPNQGAKLEPMRAFNAYWFAWADFYPDAQIYEP